MQVTLIDVMGNDDRVVDAARVSFAKEAENFTKEQNDKLIAFLAKHNHWSPFSHCMITMREKVPIFVARQRFKHMVGFTYNEVSRRYVDDVPEFFIPTEWRGKPVNAKQGSSDEVINLSNFKAFSGIKPERDLGDRHNLQKEYEYLQKAIKDLYENMIKAGVAPEQARMVLPQSMYTEYYVSGSLAAWARAYKLRIDAHAQKEIQEVAVEWDKIIRPLFPVSWSTLVD